MNYKRITLFAGHYGSGKTNAAVNYAFKMHADGFSVVVADLDTVNPYFRAKDSAAELEKEGIELVSSRFANSNVDVPALPAEMYNVVYEKERYAVLDIGGDDRGAFALGRYTPAILEENNYDMLFVINCYRPLTSSAEDTVEIMREIEKASGIPFNGIVNNSNLGPDTIRKTLEDSLSYAKEISRLTGLEIKLTTVPDTLEFEGIEDFGRENGTLLKMKLQKKLI